MSNIRGLSDLKKNEGNRAPPMGGGGGGSGGSGGSGGGGGGGFPFPSFGGLFGGGQSAPQNEGNVKYLKEGQLDEELHKAGGKLVVVDFTASWCGPCKSIAPLYADLSTKYSDVIFLKVDVDQCKSTAQACGVRSMPTFQFYKKKAKIAEFSGADPSKLQSTIEAHKTPDSRESMEGFSGTGYVLGGSKSGSEKQPDERPIVSPETVRTPSQPAAPTTSNVNEMFVSSLQDMGFSKEKAMKAVAATGGSSVQAAMDWCLEHPDDDEASATPTETTASSSEESSTPMDTESTAQTGEEPESSKTLTPEELEEKKRQLNEKIKQRKAEREKTDAKDEVNREKLRRMSGKEAQEAKRLWEQKQREREAMLAKKQREEDKKAKAAIKAKIEADRQERIARKKAQEQEVQSSSSSSTSPVVQQTTQEQQQQQQPPPVKKEYTEALVQIRLPDGNTIKATFKPQDPVRTVFNHVALLLGRDNFTMMTTFPRRSFQKHDSSMDSSTLTNAECVPTGTFIVR